MQEWQAIDWKPPYSKTIRIGQFPKAGDTHKLPSMSSHRGKSAGKGKGRFHSKEQAKKGPLKKGESQQRESTTTSVSSRYKVHPMGDSSTGTPRHTFTTVLEHLADHLEKIIVKHSKDVVSSILGMTPLTLAVEEPDHDEYISLRPEEHLRLAEQRILDRRYDDDHHHWVKRTHASCPAN